MTVIRILISAALGAGVAACGVGALSSGAGGGAWVTAAGWMMNETSPESPFTQTASMSNSTARMIVRDLVAGGEAVRIKVSNLDGTANLVVNAASVALAGEGPALVPGSVTPVTFGGEATVTVPGGEMVMSDPVALVVAAGDDLAVNIFVQLPTPVDSSDTGHAQPPVPGALYLAPGNQTTAESGGTFAAATAVMYVVNVVDVLATTHNGTIVTFGASVTEGTGASSPANNYPSRLAVRFGTEPPAGRRKTVINAGIGGDTAVGSLERVERDVLKNSRTHVLIQNGQNDLGGGATAEEVIAAYQTIIGQAHAIGVKVIVATINPRDSFNATQNGYRHQINAWVRAGGNCGGACDGIIDWDATIRDPNNPDMQNPDYRTDGIHPNDAGYAAMAAAVDLALFD